MEEIIEQLYAVYEQKMYRLAYSIVNNVEQAEDIVQEAFLKIFFNLEKIQDVSSMGTKRWILRVVKNEAVDYYRKNKRRLKLVNSLKEKSSNVEYDNNVDDKIQHMIEEEYIQVALDGLSEKDKEILLYRLFYEFSTSETAKILGIGEDGVRKRYARAKMRMSELIGGGSDEKYEKS